ncbi:MAG: plasmid stabilization protein [Proteobacteria bacterium]|nr:MAG: plasmid stabilization protein [Pseudomonadota bacterium]
MSKSYHVIWSDIAETDLKNIILYIAKDSPANARSVFEKIKEAASNLNQFPERGRLIPELQMQGVLLYRELVIAPWRLIYRTSGNEVLVLAVLDSRRNIEDILLDRLVN